jgi:hypothetical protein
MSLGGEVLMKVGMRVKDGGELPSTVVNRILGFTPISDVSVFV